MDPNVVPPMAGDAMAHLTGAAILCYLLDWMKRTRLLRWIHFDTGTLNRIISIVGAFLLSVGIQWTGDAAAGWTIHIPPLAVFLGGVYEWGKQFALQQIMFDTVPRFQRRPAARPINTEEED